MSYASYPWAGFPWAGVGQGTVDLSGDLTAFSRLLGDRQGRAKGNELFTAPEGDWLFILGEKDAKEYQALDVGNYVQVRQQVDLTGISLVRYAGFIQAPTFTPGGFGWRASIRIAGAEAAGRDIEAGRNRPVSDMVANVIGYTGIYDLAFRLEVTSG